MAEKLTSFRDSTRLRAGALAGPRNVFGLLGIVGLLAAAVGFLVNRDQFFYSYFLAFVFWLTVALGCLFFVLVNHLARAGWSVAVRRIAEVGAGAVPVFAILFLPVLFGLPRLFPWLQPGAAEHDALIHHKAGYLNPVFFLIRAAVYFGVWSLLGRYFLKGSVSQDESGDPRTTVRLQSRAAPSMILFAITLSFMAIDWMMSMDPHWYSTIFGVYIFSGSTLAGFAFITLVIAGLRSRRILEHTLRTDHFQDLGRLMFAFSVFWAYIGFSQYFLIWYGNIPEETLWFVGTWRQVGLFLAVGRFAVPFVFLMPRWTKRRPWIVTLLALWVLFMQSVDLYWMIIPNLHPEGAVLSWMGAATFSGVGGVYLYVFLRMLGGRALIPVGDPRLRESLALEHLY